MIKVGCHIFVGTGLSRMLESMSTQQPKTQIKEIAYALSSRFGWTFEYGGALEMDGEWVDDADLTSNRQLDSSGDSFSYLLNIVYADSTLFGYTLTREFAPSSSFQSGVAFGAPASRQSKDSVVAEQYFLESARQLEEVLSQLLARLG